MIKVQKKDFFYFFLCIYISSTFASENKIRNESISDLPIFTFSDINPSFHLIAIIGGKGLRNKEGRSKNFLNRTREIFVNNGSIFYLFPNKNERYNASYRNRLSDDRLSRIKKLVDFIRLRDKKPIFLIGFSRGSVDLAGYIKNYPSSIDGAIIVSGIYQNLTKKAKNYSMEKIINEVVNVDLLIVHHEKDKCEVTEYQFALKFFQKLRSKTKKILSYKDGEGTGRKCGPFNYHGMEVIEKKVALDISKWINKHIKEAH